MHYELGGAVQDHVHQLGGTVTCILVNRVWGGRYCRTTCARWGRGDRR